MRSLAALLLVFSVLLLWNLMDRDPVVGIDDGDANVYGDFGDPIPGLSVTGRSIFESGRIEFKKRYTRRQGLGPHFNASSCTSCHEDPVEGGSSQRYRDFFIAGRSLPDNSMEKLYPDCTSDNIGTHRTELCLPSVVLPHYGPKGTITNPIAADVEHPGISTDADIVTRRNAPPLFGVGLFRLVSDDEIRSREDPTDTNDDGISGRVNIIAAEEDDVGRFGYKCQTASIEAFNRGALQNQMGITSDSTDFLIIGDAAGRSYLDELVGTRTAHAQAATPRDRVKDFDSVIDPEIGRVSLLNLIFFQENLAAPRRGPQTRSVLRGEQVFDTIGCTSCHVPSLETPMGHIHPYTDLLLHDMGPDLDDGVVMSLATGSEFRTQPLWGLCQHDPFLHDGSADTIQEAILRHGGEAEEARNNYADLEGRDLRDLHRFLESL
jgi:CxxC motif-containing protein (DUF1111 family)